MGPYTVRVTFSDDAGQVEALAWYPELGCGGSWTMTDEASQNVHSFSESITFGTASCLDEVQIQIDATDANTITYEALTRYRPDATLSRDDSLTVRTGS